jgi:lambda family phage portal protein
MTMDADPGTFQSLPDGVSFQPFNPDYPTAMYADFVKANLRGIASGLGVAYHALANDLEGVSFSSIRSGTLEERDLWMVQQSWFVETFLEPLYAEWLRNALAFGLITSANGKALPLEKLDKFAAHNFIGRRWDWVDPLRDVQADITAMEAGLKAPQDICARMGTDYEDVLVKLKAAQDMRAKVGLNTPAPRPAPGAPANQEPANTEGATP